MGGYYNQYETNDASGDGVDFRGNTSQAGPIMQMALVVKVITTPTEKYQAGTIQFRILDSQGVLSTTPLKMLNYARPVNTLFVSIPTIGEYVFIVKGPSSYSTRPDQDLKQVVSHYYMTPISIRGDINHNASTDAWNIVYKEGEVTTAVASEYEDNTETPPPSDGETERISLGNDFHRHSITNDQGNEETLVMSPKLFEGDVLLSGRFGQSIRMSATLSTGAGETWRGNPDLESDPSYLKPITIIRNGMPEGAIDRYIDNISTDPSAIYLTNGQYIPELKGLTPFPLDAKGKPRTRSMNIGGLFEHGNLGSGLSQCIIRADRIVSISRNEIYQFAEKGISLATSGAITLDAGPLAIIDAGIINLGSGAGSDKDTDRDLTYAVRGEQLQKVLLELINAFSTTTVIAGGITGNLVPLPSLGVMYEEIVDGQETGLFSKKVFLE